jgi:hypothetical protein
MSKNCTIAIYRGISHEFAFLRELPTRTEEEKRREMEDEVTFSPR